MVSPDGSVGRSVVEEQEWPPGFRFHPTDEELVLYYLKRKICQKKIKLSVIAETDVYKWDPEELPGLSLLKTGDRQWFFFSPRDRKYPNGARSNRATKQGYWKATGKDRIITCGPRSVGVKKTLVFYRGRAPNGERTDWVMHEYTLDEEEFKRCQNVQGYYALYKAFKKSGPGPKNGEQYGAPFREEDWNNDCPDFNNSASLDLSVERVDEGSPNASTNVNHQVPLSSDDIEEFIKNLTEDSLPDLPPINGCAYTPSQVLSQGDVINTAVDLPCRDIAIQEPVNMLYANGVQRNLQASFNLAHVTVSEIQSSEGSNFASTAPKIDEEEVYVLPEEDFLEMDDLVGPEPINDNVVEVPNDFLVDDRDGLSEFDLYHDASMTLNEIGAGPSEAANQYEYHINPNQLGPVEVFHLQCGLVTDEDDVNQPYLELVEPINNQLYLNNADQISNQFCPDDASQSQSQGSVLTFEEFYNGIGNNYPDPTSGVAYESSDISFQVNQNQGGNEANGATSWLSSAVWSFVETIPTTPASAAENTLVNRAFGRMSSFSRLRMNAMNASIPAGSDSDPPDKSFRKRGFIFFPVLVAIIAIFWVVLRTVSIWAPSISA